MPGTHVTTIAQEPNAGRAAEKAARNRAFRQTGGLDEGGKDNKQLVEIGHGDKVYGWISILSSAAYPFFVTSTSCEGRVMTDPTFTNPLVKFLADEASKRNLTIYSLSQAAGLSKDSIYRIEARGGRAGMNMATAARLADFLQIPVQDIINHIPQAPMAREARVRPAGPAPQMPTSATPRDVPVMGTAAGSLGEGAFQMSNEPVDFVRRPESLANSRDIYAIYIENESMWPEHKPGDLRFVSPNRPPAIGDSVIIQIKNSENSEIRVYIKTLERRNSGSILCSQHNPKATIEFRSQFIVSIHKVLSMNEIYGF